MKLVTKLEKNSINRTLVFKNHNEPVTDGIVEIAQKYVFSSTSTSSIFAVVFCVSWALFSASKEWAMVIFVFGSLISLLHFYCFAVTEIVLEYKFDDVIAYEYSAFAKSISSLKEIDSMWIEKFISKKRRTTTVERIKAEFCYSLPYFLRADNLEVPAIGCDNQRFFFLPDRLLLSNDGKNHEYLYTDIKVSNKKTKFTEESGFPKDAKVIDVTWEHTNKSGEPDRRYKNNQEYSVCLYDQLIFDIGEEKICFLLSKPDSGKPLLGSFLEYIKVISKYNGTVSKPKTEISFTDYELSRIIYGAFLMIEIDGQIDRREVDKLGSFLEKYYNHNDQISMGQFLDSKIKDFKFEYNSGYFKEKIDRIFSGLNLELEKKKIVLDFYEQIMLSDNVSAETEVAAMEHFRRVL